MIDRLLGDMMWFRSDVWRRLMRFRADRGIMELFTMRSSSSVRVVIPVRKARVMSKRATADRVSRFDRLHIASPSKPNPSHNGQKDSPTIRPVSSHAGQQEGSAQSLLSISTTSSFISAALKTPSLIASIQSGLTKTVNRISISRPRLPL